LRVDCLQIPTDYHDSSDNIKHAPQYQPASTELVLSLGYYN
jgi:hypothetical protein